MVVLVGDSSTGKTRALWEAIQRLPQKWRVWHPVTASALNDGLTGGAVGHLTVVWLNDAHNYLDPAFTELAGSNAALLRELLENAGAGPILVAATFWTWTWQQLTAEPRQHSFPAEPSNLKGNLAQVSALLELATYIPVPDSFEGEGLGAMAAIGRHDPRVALALQRATHRKIAQYLAGAQKVLERYETTSTEIRALIDAAIDARRFGYPNHLSERFLVEAASGYIDKDIWDRLGDDWAAEALHSATLDWRRLDGPLTRIKPRPREPVPDIPEYKLADVLEQTGGRNRRYFVPPEEFWDTAVRYCHGEGLKALAEAAWRRGRYRNAAVLYLKAAGSGDPGGLANVARMREAVGDSAGAERLYQQAASFGDADALAMLASIRERAGDHAGAERLAAEAAEGGNTRALEDLAATREDAGDHEKAEKLAAKAAEAGNARALVSLTFQRESAGDHARAERLAAEAAEGRRDVGAGIPRLPARELWGSRQSRATGRQGRRSSQHARAGNPSLAAGERRGSRQSRATGRQGRRGRQRACAGRSGQLASAGWGQSRCRAAVSASCRRRRHERDGNSGPNSRGGWRSCRSRTPIPKTSGRCRGRRRRRPDVPGPQASGGRRSSGC